MDKMIKIYKIKINMCQMHQNALLQAVEVISSIDLRVSSLLLKKFHNKLIIIELIQVWKSQMIKKS
jgi:hypothetical protein